MPTQEQHIADNIIAITWTAPLNPEELDRCFRHLAAMMDEQPAQTVHLLFDLTEAGSIPGTAPMLAIRSGFMSLPNTGRVAVLSRDAIAQILAKLASTITRKEITFFSREEKALAYLQEDLLELR